MKGNGIRNGEDRTSNRVPTMRLDRKTGEYKATDRPETKAEARLRRRQKDFADTFSSGSSGKAETKSHFQVHKPGSNNK